MLPRDLNPESFAGYPPQGRALVLAHLDAIRQLPLAFVPSLLRQIVDYDYSFPIERSATEQELEILQSLSAAQRDEWFRGFSAILTSSALEKSDWINSPSRFVEQQSAYLWSTHQLDAFRKAALDYGDRLSKLRRSDPITMQRLGISVVGKGVSEYDGRLFKDLRKQGTWFTQVKPDGALETLISAVEQRAKQRPAPYQHWYVDGDMPLRHGAGITSVSYASLGDLRLALLKRMQAEIARPGMGPEELRTRLAQMTPADLEMDKAADPVLSRFQIRLFTEASGTQIYSTTFAQWTGREILRRAQALTLLVRYAPRQRQRPMNELLSGKPGEVTLDAIGSLVDADMGAYYHWIDQQRLPGSEQSAFIAWFEDHGEAVAIGPAVPRGAESHAAIEMGRLLSLVST